MEKIFPEREFKKKIKGRLSKEPNLNKKYF